MPRGPFHRRRRHSAVRGDCSVLSGGDAGYGRRVEWREARDEEAIVTFEQLPARAAAVPVGSM